MGVMKMIAKAGDIEHKWNPGNPQEVAAARAVFDLMVREKRYMAYSGQGVGGAQLRQFDPAADTITFVPPMQGG